MLQISVWKDIYSEISWFCYRHTIDGPNPRSVIPILEWLKLRQLLPYLSHPRYFPINCLCRLLAGRFQPTRSITANRLIFTRSIFPGIFHKTRCPSVQTSITAVSPWSRGKRSSLERTGGALVRREIPLYTRSRGARITSPPPAKLLSEKRRYRGGESKLAIARDRRRVSSR